MGNNSQVSHHQRGYIPPKEAEPPVNLSDRRLGKAVRLIRLAATTAGATEVSELDAWSQSAFPTGEFFHGENHGEFHRLKKRGTMFFCKRAECQREISGVFLLNGCWVLACSIYIGINCGSRQMKYTYIV